MHGACLANGGDELQALVATPRCRGRQAKRQRTDGNATAQTPGTGGKSPVLPPTFQPPAHALPPTLSSVPGSALRKAQPPALPPNQRPSAIPPPPPTTQGQASSTAAAAGVNGGASRIPCPGAHAPDAAACTFAPPAPLAPPARLQQVWGHANAACAPALQPLAFTLPTSDVLAGTSCIRLLPAQPAAHLLQLQPLQPASSDPSVTATVQPATPTQLAFSTRPESQLLGSAALPPLALQQATATATPTACAPACGGSAPTAVCGVGVLPPVKAAAPDDGAEPCAPQHPASGSVVCIDTAEVEGEAEAPAGMDVEEDDWEGDWAAAPSPSQVRPLSPLAQPVVWSLPRDREVADGIHAAAWQDESFGVGGVEEGELSLLIHLLG